jgi:hypothetical protein
MVGTVWLRFILEVCLETEVVSWQVKNSEVFFDAGKP